MAPVPVIFSNQDEGAPGPSLLGTGDYNYDSRSMLMTTAAICATREVSWWPSYYRGEQYDSDLGLYYLRARYYNPTTGRFMSRDPEGGNAINPKTLHKYLYAGNNPVRYADPRGRDLFEYGIRSSAAIPEAKLIDIYGCVAGAALAAADLILLEVNPNDTTGNIGTGLGVGSAVLGCVVLMPGLNELAGSGAKVTKAALEFVGSASGLGACAADAKDFVNGLNGILSGNPNEEDIGKSIEDLAGCVGSALGQMLRAEAE